MERGVGGKLICWGFGLAIILLIRGVDGANEYNRFDDPIPNTLEAYERCKHTHRCPRGYSEYDLLNATRSFASSIYFHGVLEYASLFEDFEDWKVGTYGWSSKGENLTRKHKKTMLAHFSSFDFETLAGLDIPQDFHVVFNSTDASMKIRNETSAEEQVLYGEIVATSHGTQVAVYNFDWINLHGNVSMFGSRAMALLSRSSVILGSQIDVDPGTLGGFPGGLSMGRNNLNGPGSSSERVYLWTVATKALDVDEIQYVATSANPGQTLAGSFVLEFHGHRTHPIPHDSSPDLLKARLERSTPAIGKLDVSRSSRSDEGGYRWSITFKTAIGNVEQIQVHSHALLSNGASVTTGTVQDGNSIGGSFKLSMFNRTTAGINFNETSQALRMKILDAFQPHALNVQVQRSDASMDQLGSSWPYRYGKCDHGLCADSPGPSGGLTWAILISTRKGLINPTSPTSDLTSQEGQWETLSGDGSQLTGTDARVEVVPGHFLAHGKSFTQFRIENHTFTIAYGGAGASFGGVGSNGGTPTYGSKDLPDLVGGSGGAIGDVSIRSIAGNHPPAGGGGHGGGAFEMAAVNDIVIESTAGISANGQDGRPAFHGGGGGSGGAIVLSAGGVVWMKDRSYLQVRGGRGGESMHGVTGGVGAGGRIVIGAQSITVENMTGIDIESGEPGLDSGRGSLHVVSEFDSSYHVESSFGASGTNRCLKLSAISEQSPVTSSIKKPDPMRRDGPEYQLQYDRDGLPPNRITLFFRLGNRFEKGTVRDNWSALIGLHGLGDNEKVITIGIGVMDGHMFHGSNFPTLPTELLWRGVEQEIWYKVDILINWKEQKYTVRINDEERAIDASFFGTGISSVGLYTFPGSTVWYDEIFVGRDYTANFRCPYIDENGDIVIERPKQTDWKEHFLGQQDEKREIQRHESHLSRRAYFQNEENTGMIYSGGGQGNFFVSEVRVKSKQAQPYSDRDRTGRVHFGALLYSPADSSVNGGKPPSSEILDRSRTTAQNGRHGAWKWSREGESQASKGESGRFFWYGEHRNENGSDYLRGGVMACSTNDFSIWRNEGTMLNFANISYDGGVPRTRVVLQASSSGDGAQTFGTSHQVEIEVQEIIGEGNWTDQELLAERPKVLYNALTDKFVMWMEVHDHENELGVAAVATADYPGGPFTFVHSFLPDGNDTHDQTVIKTENGDAFLVRTYYATVDYVLPERVMQPIWESVKYLNGETNFALNFHRAFYDIGYDDSNDICTQRMRKESEPLQILMLPENETVPADQWIKNVYSGNGTLEKFVLEEQSEPWKDRFVLGLGDPPIQSHFKHPNWTENNAWMPNSVPAVKAQEWSFNYLDGNIADNPVHSTPPDKLIGPPRVAERRRTKYVAVSLLRPDYLNCSGVLSIVEGQIESEDDLIAVLTDLNEFDFSASVDSLVPYERRSFPETCKSGESDEEWENCNLAKLQKQQSTTPGQVWGLDAPFNFVTEYDWQWRYHQYRWAKGDRGSAPINFVDQIVPWGVPGRGESRTPRGRAFIREYDHNCMRGPNEFDPDDERYIPADELFNHELSQHYTKTEGADIESTRAHLLDW